MAKSKRRGSREGSIFQRKDGRWCGQIDLGWQNGKRGRKLIYGKTQGAVRELLTKALHDHDRGMLSADNPTVQRFLEDWLASVKTSLRVRSYERYEGIVRKHLVPTLGRLRLDRLTPAHVQALLDAKLASGLAPRTVQGCRIVLVAALKQGVQRQVVSRNVASFVPGPKVRNAEMQVFNPEQARQFLATSQGEPLHALYLLALHTGLRRGELLALKWEDLDLDAGTLSVHRALGRSMTQGIVIAEPKTPQGRRTVRLAAPVVSVLRVHRKRQLEHRLMAGQEWHEQGYLSTTSRGAAIDPNALGRDFRRVCALAGLPAIRFHDLRHSAATIALSQGVHPKIVSEMLGHSRISLTLDVYSHSLPTLQVEAADKIAAALGGETRAK